MSFADALAVPPPPAVRRCAFRTWRDGLSETDRAAVDAALHGRRDDGRHVWSSRDLATRLSDNGYSISPGTVNNHRNGTCAACRSLTS